MFSFLYSYPRNYTPTTLFVAIFREILSVILVALCLLMGARASQL